jgi:flagellar assembly factor FliW
MHLAAERNGVRMDIETTRFGRITVDDERVISIPRGLLGFPDYTRYALIQTGEENYFFWLQCVEQPNLAFVVADPSIFFKDYEVPLRDENLQELQLEDLKESQVFVICNKVGEWLTGNLLGPIVVNAQTRVAQQAVLTDKKWTTRQPLMKLPTEVPLAKSAREDPRRCVCPASTAIAGSAQDHKRQGSAGPAIIRRPAAPRDMDVAG